MAVDLEDPRNREIAGVYSISMVPIFLLIDANGTERGRIIGAPDLGELRGAAALLMAETCAGVAATGSGELPRDGERCPGASVIVEEDDETLFSSDEEMESCQG